MKVHFCIEILMNISIILVYIILTYVRLCKEVVSMYDVLDICRYIINYSNEQGYDISNLKLQKLLYFVQAFFLIISDGKKPCFGEEIEAWDFGPVVPRAYHQYKRYGNMDIPVIIRYYEKDERGHLLKRIYNRNCISKNDRKEIRDVVDEFRDYTASDLVELTHSQDPWKDAYEPYMNNPISNEAILRYFS